MSASRHLPLALTAFAVLVAPAALGAQSTRYTLSGADVAVYNLVGLMRVEPGSGSSVVVEVTRGGADAAQLRIDSGELSGRPTLRVIYPGDHIVYPAMGRNSETRLSVRDDGTFSGRGGHDVTVAGSGSGVEAHADLRVMVPEGQRIAVNVAVGRVTVRT